MNATCNTTTLVSKFPFELAPTETNGTESKRTFRKVTTAPTPHLELNVPNVACVNDSIRIVRFQRVLQTAIIGHTVTVTIFSFSLLIIISMLGATHSPVFSGLVGYFAATLLSAIVFRQSIQNAAFQDSKV